MVRVEHFAGFDDAVGDVNQFAHGGAHDLHLGFASLRQTLAESPHDRVVLLGDDCWQKQRFADSGVTGL